MNTHRFGHWIPEYIYSRVEWLQIFETLLYSSRVVDRIPLPWWSTVQLATVLCVYINSVKATIANSTK